MTRRLYADPTSRSWHLYRLTNITRGRATVTYAGDRIGTVEEQPSGYWRALLGRRRIGYLYATRRAARDAIINRHAAQRHN